MDEPLASMVDETLKSEYWYLEAAQHYLETLTPAINLITKDVQEKEIGLTRQLVYRCIIKRTEENLLAILATTETPHAFVGPAILRPLCEDLIYACWLATLSNSDADIFIDLGVRDDQLRSLRAQLRFLPQAYKTYTAWSDAEMEEHLQGWVRTEEFIDQQQMVIDDERRQIKTDLRALGLKLGWPRGRVPSVRSMAEDCDPKDVYESFYHGTSKAVHSDLHHMVQTVSCEPGNILNISSQRMAVYNKLFALAYGVWLTELMLCKVTEPEFPDECKLVDFEAHCVWLSMVLSNLSRNGKLPPLVTPQEESALLAFLIRRRNH